jgi:hypothetical protein
MNTIILFANISILTGSIVLTNVRIHIRNEDLRKVSLVAHVSPRAHIVHLDLAQYDALSLIDAVAEAPKSHLTTDPSMAYPTSTGTSCADIHDDAAAAAAGLDVLEHVYPRIVGDGNHTRIHHLEDGVGIEVVHRE